MSRLWEYLKFEFVHDFIVCTVGFVSGCVFAKIALYLIGE